MGAEAMSSHGSRVGAALSRQGSVCSLTFSEVEDGQLMHGVNLDGLLRSSGRKTADEVWRDIQGAAPACPRARAQMTLEDFLSRGGGPPAAADTDTGSGARGWAQQLYQPAPAPAAAQLDLGRHHPAVVGRPVAVARPVGAVAGPVLDALYHDGQAAAKRAAGEVQRAAQEADDQEPGVGGEVARAQAGVHERAGEQDLAAGGGERAAPAAQGTRAGSALCAATGAEESAPAS